MCMRASPPRLILSVITRQCVRMRDKDTSMCFPFTQLLSEDPSNYRDAPTEGIRRILEQGAPEKPASTARPRN